MFLGRQSPSLCPEECAVRVFDLPPEACRVIQERGDLKCQECEEKKMVINEKKMVINTGVCSIEGCEKKAVYKKSGLCRKHYNLQRYHDKVAKANQDNTLPRPPIEPRPSKQASVILSPMAQNQEVNLTIRIKIIVET